MSEALRASQQALSDRHAAERRALANRHEAERQALRASHRTVRTSFTLDQPAALRARLTADPTVPMGVHARFVGLSPADLSRALAGHPFGPATAARLRHLARVFQAPDPVIPAPRDAG